MTRRFASFPLALAALLATAAPPSRGDEPTPRPTARLLSFDQLQERLGAPNLRLLDPRPRGDYEKGHIPGAVWVDLKAAEGLAQRPNGLTDKDAWDAWIAPLGLDSDAEVVVYDARRQLDAARLWWLLGYLGVDRVGLVNGGFPLWKEQGRPVSDKPADVRPKPYPVRFQKERIADVAAVRKALEGGGTRIIDARSDAEYTGEKALSKRGGHIPTACPLEWKSLVDDQGRFLDPAALRTRLDELGVQAGTPVITHCQGGGRASVDAFVLERLGHPARNYYLGWSDWGNREDVPVATGKDRGEKP